MPEKLTTREIFQAILIILAVFIVTFFLWLRPEKTTEILPVTTPTLDTPPINSEPSKEIHTIELLTKPYTPSADPYGIGYSSDALRLAFNGEFSSILIRIQGETVGEGYRFLSFNFGTESGILNAVRKSLNSLDVENTIKKGGAFNKSISATIDLLKEIEIGSNGTDYRSTGKGTKTIKFWDKIGIQPATPTVAPLLIAPFTESGTYGGGVMNSLKVDYVCKDNSQCTIKLCPIGKITTQCLLDNFDKGAAKSWCEHSKKCDPKQFN